jgi:hypothetical protein
MNEDFSFEKEGFWLTIQETCRRYVEAEPEAYGLVPYDTLMERRREILDACWLEIDAESAMENRNLIGLVANHLTKVIACAMTRELYTLQLEAHIRTFGIEVAPAGPWDIGAPPRRETKKSR